MSERKYTRAWYLLLVATASFLLLMGGFKWGGISGVSTLQLIQTQVRYVTAPPTFLSLSLSHQELCARISRTSISRTTVIACQKCHFIESNKSVGKYIFISKRLKLQACLVSMMNKDIAVRSSMRHVCKRKRSMEFWIWEFLVMVPVGTTISSDTNSL